MRHHAVFCTLILGVVALPLSAQANQKISILNNDTSVTIERGAQNSCRVEVNGKALAERDAKPICETRQRSITWSGNSGTLAFGENNGVPGLQLFGGFDSLATARPIIGVTVDTRARDTDRYGAYIVAVTPSGPADKAGLRSGDIITRVAGRSVTAGATSRSVSSDESRPYVRLIEVMATLDAGKEISLDYRRGDANLSTKVTPRDDGQVFASSTAQPLNDAMTYLRRSMSGDSIASTIYFGDEGPIPPAMPRQRSSFGYSFSNVLGSTELAPMNEKLGRYFGTESGVLIIDTDSRNAFGLQPGDVVQSIDGRSIENPNELGRVLRSYESGDRISIGLVRDKKKQTVSARLP